MGPSGSFFNRETQEMEYPQQYYDRLDVLNKLQAVESSFFNEGIHSMDNLGRQVNEIGNAGFRDDVSAAQIVKKSGENAVQFNSWVDKQDWITAADKKRLIENTNNNYAGAIKAKYDSYVAHEMENLEQREQALAEQAKRDAEIAEKNRQLSEERQRLNAIALEQERAVVERQRQEKLEAWEEYKKGRQKIKANVDSEEEAEQFMRRHPAFPYASIIDKGYFVKHEGYLMVNEPFRIGGETNAITAYGEGFVMRIIDRRSGWLVEYANTYMVTRDWRFFVRMVPSNYTDPFWIAR
jgi:hypothetical protein